MKRKTLTIVIAIITVLLGSVVIYSSCNQNSESIENDTSYEDCSGEECSTAGAISQNEVSFKESKDKVELVIKNTGDDKVFVRLSAFILEDENGSSDCAEESDSDGWEFKNDSYYYKHSLKPGESTKPLVFKEDSEGNSLIASDIVYLSESVLKGNLSSKEAWSKYDSAGSEN